MALVRKLPARSQAPILSLPDEILSDILFRSLPCDEYHKTLLSVSTVCTTFQKSIRSFRKLYIDWIILDKLASFYPLESDFNFQVSKLIDLAPSAVKLKVWLNPAGTSLPPATLLNWSRVVGQTLISLQLKNLAAGHLEYLSKFGSLENLTVDVSLQNDWLAKLEKCDPVPNVKSLKVTVAVTSQLKMFKPFLDLFPNLKFLGIRITCSRGFDENFFVEHSRLESLEIGMKAPVVSIMCPKLTSLGVGGVGGTMDINSAVSLKRLDCTGAYTTTIEMSKVNQSEITHLEFSQSTDTRVLQALLFNCRDSMQDLTVDSIEPLTRYQESLRVSTGSSKLFCFSSLTRLNVHNIKLSSTKMDYLGRVSEGIDDRLYLTLDNWISTSPALKQLFVTYWTSDNTAEYVKLFTDTVIPKLKRNHPGVTVMVQSGKVAVGMHLWSWD